MQTSLPPSTQFEFRSFPSFETLLPQTSQHASASSAFVITGKERKLHVRHSTSSLLGLVSTVCNTGSLLTRSAVEISSSSFFSVLSSLQPG